MTTEDRELLEDNAQYLARQNQVFQGRVTKMQALADDGVSPFATGFRPGHRAQDLQGEFASLEPEALEERAIEVAVAGRIMAMRKFGRAAFVSIMDRSARIQAHIRKDLLGEACFAMFKKLDVGDIVGVEGTLFITRTGELTVRAQTLHLLTKSLRPLPEKWHGLSDQETRLRQRYVDCIVNDEVRETFRKRAAIVRYLRRFLEERGFLEVETPMMHPTPGGAVAKPFVTHHNALGVDLFLRIAPELYLKRLIVGGFEQVFEVNRNFRNEGLSRKHNPEFTMLEFYWAYANFEELMSLTEEMFSGLAEELLGTDEIEYGGNRISLKKPWRRLRVRDGVLEHTRACEADLDDREKLIEILGELDDPPAAKQIERMSDGHLLMEIFDRAVEHHLIDPTFIYEYPASVSPLSRRNDENPEYVDRFELVIAGMEMANAFNELNDPIDQRQRFLTQLEARQAGDDEAHPMDDDYIRALEYGMPPCAGEGVGIDRLVMLLTGADTIREVILFPQLRPEQ